MNTIFFLWSSILSTLRALGRRSDHQEQLSVEHYLSNSQSIADLEYREHQWLRSQHSGNDFFPASN